MYNILPETKDHIIVIRIEGYTNSQDIKTLLPYLTHRIKKHGKIRILVILKEVSGIEMFGFLKTIPFFFKYRKIIEKKAILTDEIWVYKWTNIFKSLFNTKIHCFPSYELVKAWEWLEK
ncbi:MAG: STAS/SEC14 domain-containing protein [Alphaproteobacteria bacterium]|nr:STAS/SEC14 domain-containing protein [Alphaproteobacteria bacterium]